MEATLNGISRDYSRHPLCWGGGGAPLYQSQVDITPNKDHLQDIAPNIVRIGGQGPGGRTRPDASDEKNLQQNLFLSKTPFFVLGVQLGVRKGVFRRPKGVFKRPSRTSPNQNTFFEKKNTFF